ncbi:MAG: hypothetical protein LUD29_02430 [Clostridia bacterium]|nr:hypothetical protein [Clostridia bacterium]
MNVLDLYYTKWHRKDEDADLLEYLEGAATLERFTLTDEEENRLGCEMVDILVLYRRLYVVTRPDEPIYDISTPTPSYFR